MIVTTTFICRSLITVLAYLSFTFPTCAFSQNLNDSKTPFASDSAQVVSIVDSWQMAWNNHDMHLFRSLFHEDGIWVLWNGKVWKSRDTIEAGLAQVHKTVYRNSIQKLQIEELRFVGPDAAAIRLYSTLTGDERYPDKVVESRKMFVCTKRNNVWKISWGQNTRFPEFTTKQ
jgi:uncharacterized protein (TIGR02246 family)